MCVRSSDSVSNGYTPPLSNKHIFHSTFSLDAPLVSAHFWTPIPSFPAHTDGSGFGTLFLLPPLEVRKWILVLVDYGCAHLTCALANKVRCRTLCVRAPCCPTLCIRQKSARHRKMRCNVRVLE